MYTKKEDRSIIKYLKVTGCLSFQDSSESDEKHSKYIENSEETREQETQINQKHTESSEFEQYIEFLSKIELLWEQSEEKQSCRER